METLAVSLAVPLAKVMLPILLTWATARWDSFWKTKTKNEKLLGLLTRVDDAVATAVKAVQQTYLDAIERGLKDDGRLSEKEKKEAFELALATAKAQLPPEVLAGLEALYGHRLDSFLGAKIEAAVRDLKRPAMRDAFVVPGLTRQPT